MEKVADIRFSSAVQSRILAGETLAGAAALLEGERDVFIVYDRAMEGGSVILRRALPDERIFPLRASESAKTMDTVLSLCRAMMTSGVSRTGLVVAIGGGITCDLAGFAASIYKRGVRFAFIPTTLLSQVDAAIGGKTGVNVDTYKNMLGVIAQPEWVYLCPEVLSTLPEREYRCGLAEMLKTFLIADAGLYEDAVSALGAPTSPRQSMKSAFSMDCSPETAALSMKSAFSMDCSPETAATSMNSALFMDCFRFIIAAARIKAAVVERDPYERSFERRKLNFGHTFAHAIESVAQRRGDDIRHGEAVAMGMILAARLGDALETAGAARFGDALETAGATSPARFPEDNGLAVRPERFPSAPDGAYRQTNLPAAPGLAERLAADFRRLGLPVECPYPLEALSDAMARDKKVDVDGIRFVLLKAVGEPCECVLTVQECLALLSGGEIPSLRSE